MIELIVDKITGIISLISYFGIFILMALESTAFPLPSELVMPFAGFLVAEGKMSFVAVILTSTLGSLAGSLLSYYIGYYGSYKFVKKFGKYFLLNREHLKKAEKWFSKHGKRTVFFSRFVPGVRHVISIPAGIGKMKLAKFSLFTILGAGIWNTVLLTAGFILEKNWKIVYSYSKYIDIILIFLVIAAIVYYAFYLINRKH
jgi:membrane protein DedA with SNARE-associated domain